MINAAVIGTGNVGCDLAFKLSRDHRFRLRAAVSRRTNSPGIRKLSSVSEVVITEGVHGLEPLLPEIDVVFDATDAEEHKNNWSVLKRYDVACVDLTPSRLGKPSIPGLELPSRINDPLLNFSVITCGAQAAGHLISAITRSSSLVYSVEVSSSIASRSAGPATRRNLDYYIYATEQVAKVISGATHSKAILILNPVDPPTLMRTTVQAHVGHLDQTQLRNEIDQAVTYVQSYVLGYELIHEPILAGDLLTVSVRVTGAGDFLPPWAGNLDIICAASLEVAFNSVKTLRDQ